MSGLKRESFAQLVAAAQAQSCRGLVFLSTLFAGDPSSEIGQLHKEKEDLIRESGLPGTFVRAGAFMTNSYQWIGSIKEEGVVYNAMGMGKTAPIAPADIAAVAVKALTTSNASNELLEVTGAELLNVPEQVGILAHVLGREIRCVDISPEAAVERFIRAGFPAPIAAAVGQSFGSVREGRVAVTTDTVARVTGKSPEKFESWAREHLSRFA